VYRQSAGCSQSLTTKVLLSNRRSIATWF
jgi:hypothetical protein